ncbi:MAG: hypothetical protein AAF573_18270 [Bacteroidota bacterium]
MKRPYDIAYLKKYVENQLTTEEDMQVGSAIQNDPDLQLIVEGIEMYLESDQKESLEDFLENSNRQIFKNLASPLNWSIQKNGSLAPSEQSFQHWLLENQLFSKSPLGIVIALLSAAAVTFLFSKPLNFQIENPTKSMSYLFQVLVLVSVWGFYLKTNAPKVPQNSNYYRAFLGRRQVWEILEKLVAGWSVLYLALFTFSLTHLSKDIGVPLLNFFNNITVVYIYLCYFSLNSNSLNLTYANDLRKIIQEPIRKLEIRGWAIVTLVLAFEIVLLQFYSSATATGQSVQLLFGLGSGLAAMALTTNLVRRLGSKDFSLEDATITLLLFYAGIQPLLPFIFPESESTISSLFPDPSVGNVFSILLVVSALFGKLLLLAFIFWGIKTNRIIHYLKNVHQRNSNHPQVIQQTLEALKEEENEQPFASEN